MLAPGRSDTRATRRPSRRRHRRGRAEKWVAASLQRPPSLAHLSVTAAIAPDRADHDRKSWRQQPAPAARRRCTWQGGQRETKKIRVASTGPALATRKTVSTVPAAGPRQPGPTALSRPTRHLPRVAGGCLPTAVPCPESHGPVRSRDDHHLAVTTARRPRQRGARSGGWTSKNGAPSCRSKERQQGAERSQNPPVTRRRPRAGPPRARRRATSPCAPPASPSPAGTGNERPPRCGRAARRQPPRREARLEGRRGRNVRLLARPQRSSGHALRGRPERRVGQHARLPAARRWTTVACGPGSARLRGPELALPGRPPRGLAPDTARTDVRRQRRGGSKSGCRHTWRCFKQ